MAKKHPSQKYIPKLGHMVMAKGIASKLVVVSIDEARKTVVVSGPATPPVSYELEWSKLSYLDESQNALRVVREATED